MNCISTKILLFLQTEVLQCGSVLSNDTELFAGGLLDSMNLIQLMAFVEENFDVSVEPLELSYENFGSVDRLTRFVESKIKQAEH